jgi:hypothetical protein
MGLELLENGLNETMKLMADGGSLVECAEANARDPLLPGSHLSTPLIGIMVNPLL